MKIGGLRAMLRNRLHREEIYSRPEFWDSKASGLKGKAVSMWPNNHLNELYHAEQVADVSRLLPDVKGKRILDAGCGTGRMSRFLAERGATVTAFDFSAGAIEIARGESDGANPTYRVQSLFDLDDRNAYDVVLSWGVVTVACKSRDDLQNAFARFRQALVAGGQVLTVEPIHRGFLHRVLNMSLSEFLSVVKQEGFRIEAVVQLHFWPTRLLLAYVAWPRFLTVPGYRAGQWMMRTLFRNRAFGDYKGILARKVE